MNTSTNYAELFYSGIANDIDTLEKNVKKYPFSSVTRFLLLYHYQKKNNPAFDKLAKQTGIYFNNPFWIQYQLTEIYNGNLSTGFAFESAEEPIPEILVSGNIPEENKESSFQEGIQNEKAEENIPVAIEEPITEIPVPGNIPEEKKESSFQEEIQNEKTEENIPAAIEESITEIPVSENNFISEENKESSFQEEIQNGKAEENIPAAIEEPGLPAAKQITEIPVSENNFVSEENKECSFQEEIQNEKKEENIPAVVEEPGLPAGRQAAEIPVSENDTINEERKEEQGERTILKPFESESYVAANNEEEPISFEPLHTVDYFASQGIKISEEVLENDHLGQQVKSFTAWLKSMKKLHPGQLPEQNEVIEKIIQSSAEVSNQNANVLTEAMAEVLIKQNKKEKAIEMYQKLSLINPSKSAYFAAKIESLKIV
ncbi:MAG TPA: hypothetical protein VMU83_12690 [Hanamia sp.]|nr:hypothetical protein [Hanamia sp.]